MHLPWSNILHVAHAAGDGERIKTGRSSGPTGSLSHSFSVKGLSHRS